MMAFRLLLSCVLLTSGFSAEIPVFVQTGNSVQLEIQTQELPEFDDLSWKKEKNINIVKYFNKTKEVRPHSSYKDRVDFNAKTFSLTLKNMQKTDSGLYTAQTRGESDNNIVTYRVSVIDAVEAPVLTVNSNSSSPDPCYFTCKGSNIIISSIYNGSSCSPEEVKSSGNYNLRLSCTDFITCNYSNPVSWKKDTKTVNEICTVKKAAPAFPLWVLVICLITLASASAVAAVISFRIYKRKKGTQTNEQTIYAEVNDNIKTQNPLEMLEKSEYPQTVYDTAGDSGQTDVTNHTKPNDDPMSQGGSLSGKSKPMTIYCAIQQQPKPPKTETDHTIYGVVNKPSVKYESAHPQSE